jgi:hypothetical protein
MHIHLLPERVKGATHIVITEIVEAFKRRAIIVRGDLANGVDGEIRSAGLSEHVVFIEGDDYQAIYNRAEGRGYTDGGWALIDLFAIVDKREWREQ